MNWTPLRAAALTALLGLLLGCTPALNWRSVPLPEAGITVLLPCKPDQATRSVELAGASVELSMVGCEADGALLAVSHAALADPSQAGAALRHWRDAVIAHVGAGAAGSAVDTPFAPAGALPLPQSVRTVVQGQRADGSQVFAQGVWFARAAGSQMRIYHAVVYTPKPRPDLADQFFAGMVLP